MNTWMDLGSSRYAHGRDRQNGKPLDRVRGIVKPLVMRHQLSNPAHIQRKMRRDHKALGLCLYCSEPAMPNPKGGLFSLCAKHRPKNLASSRAFHKKRSLQWRKLGICVVCGLRLSIKATTPGATDTRCAVCVERRENYTDRTKASKQKH